jgi:multicomponent Na+:H+ antiporter subunit E
MIASIATRVLVIAAVWLAVTELRPSALVYALVAVPLVVAATYVITGAPRRGHRRGIAGSVALVVAIARCGGWVAGSAVVGGADVARRALALPHADIDPVSMSHRTRLRTPAGRTALALLLNLTPGTLTSRLSGDVIDVHVITTEMDIAATLDALEGRLEAIERAGR